MLDVTDLEFMSFAFFYLGVLNVHYIHSFWSF